MTLEPLTEVQRQIIAVRQGETREIVNRALESYPFQTMRSPFRGSPGFIQHSRLLMFVRRAIKDEGRDLLHSLAWKGQNRELHIPWQVHRMNIAISSWSGLRMDRTYYLTNMVRHEGLVSFFGEGWTAVDTSTWLPRFAGISDEDCYAFLGHLTDAMPEGFREDALVFPDESIRARRNINSEFQLPLPTGGQGPYLFAGPTTVHGGNRVRVSISGLVEIEPNADSDLSSFSISVSVIDSVSRTATNIVAIVFN